MVSAQPRNVCLGQRHVQPADGETALSGVWGGYAAVLLAAGFNWRSAVVRWSGLALFALTLCKVFLIDMSQLPGFYRVSAFLALSILMAGAAWGYQKFELAALVQRPQGDRP